MTKQVDKAGAVLWFAFLPTAQRSKNFKYETEFSYQVMTWLVRRI